MDEEIEFFTSPESKLVTPGKFPHDSVVGMLMLSEPLTTAELDDVIVCCQELELDVRQLSEVLIVGGRVSVLIFEEMEVAAHPSASDWSYRRSWVYYRGNPEIIFVSNDELLGD